MQPAKPHEPWWVLATKDQSGGWTVAVSQVCPPGLRVVELNTDATEADVTHNVSDAVTSIKDPVWRHELAAFAFQKQSRPIGLAGQIAAVAGTADGGMAGRIGSLQETRDVAYALRAMLGRFGRVRGLQIQKWRARSEWFAVAIPAWIGLVASVVRYGGSSPAALSSNGTIHAVHGEWETRTRHLLPPNYDPGADAIYLIIGRPRTTLRNARATIDPERRLNHAKLVRPLDFVAAVRALPHGASRLAAGVGDAAAGAVRLTMAEKLALAYRMMQGSAHRIWWRRCNGSPHTVLFGHTGTADTSQLELAMQSGGARTVHVVHGVNHGWPFAGLSDVGIFQSEHDAGLARRIGDYERTCHLPSALPELIAEGQGWLILTSYTHPMGRPYALHGVKPDVEALNIVAGAARQVGISAASVVWRPHPAIERVSAEDRQAVEACAAGHGFTRWPAGRPLEEMVSFAVIMTTPSTVLLDALKLGKRPILIATAPMQRDVIYSSYPARAGSTAECVGHLPPIAAKHPSREQYQQLAPGQFPAGARDLLEAIHRH